jgi:hypothetical protein
MMDDLMTPKENIADLTAQIQRRGPFCAQPRRSGIIAVEDLSNPSRGHHPDDFAISKGFASFFAASVPAPH